MLQPDSSSGVKAITKSYRLDESLTFSSAQLHYDKRKEYLRLRASAPAHDDQDHLNLRQTLRNTRNALPVMPGTHHFTEPVQYARNGSVAPFGAPMVFNTEATVNTVRSRNNSNNAAPYVLEMPAITAHPPARPVRKAFRTKKYCIVCGWQKKEHVGDEKPGRHNKKGESKCGRQYCEKCFMMRAEHDQRGIAGMGPDCTRTPTDRA